ncbi:hypothetical protein HYALB_00001339 [Hymenoscyphus albidus]|uniref:glutathione-specific gamma-glutamylcyclotransferase n=1 Tax=Hymenoscyphus albidus TaxID=595503 RepID=A0A9N9LCX0_9HELO|nr:hypothetical protein HYALB_00001339 [Hymenoscyphus albidus]
MSKEATSEAPAPEEEFWLFGYGNTESQAPTQQHLYHASPKHKLKPLSEDHRGTPEAPGRVVTLISRSFWETLDDHHPSKSDKVWGTAYRIEADKVKEVKEYLDIREINGYTVHYTTFHPATPISRDSSTLTPTPTPTIKTLVYIGTPDNEQFLGPQDPQKLAEHIYHSVGPSGPNIDYLLSLQVALDNLSPESGDEHIKDLANRIRALQASTDDADLEKRALEREVSKMVNHHSVDEQEEVEKHQS